MASQFEQQGLWETETDQVYHQGQPYWRGRTPEFEVFPQDTQGRHLVSKFKYGFPGKGVPSLRGLGQANVIRILVGVRDIPDQPAKPAKGAFVSVFRHNRFIASGKTGVDGAFRFEFPDDVKGLPLTVNISKEGYRDFSATRRAISGTGSAAILRKKEDVKEDVDEVEVNWIPWIIGGSALLLLGGGRLFAARRRR